MVDDFLIKRSQGLSVISIAAMHCLWVTAVPTYGQAGTPRYQKQVDNATWRLVSRSARQELEKASKQIAASLDSQPDEKDGTVFVRTLDAAGALLDSRAVEALRPY